MERLGLMLDGLLATAFWIGFPIACLYLGGWTYGKLEKRIKTKWVRVFAAVIITWAVAGLIMCALGESRSCGWIIKSM